MFGTERWSLIEVTLKVCPAPGPFVGCQERLSPEISDFFPPNFSLGFA